MIRKRDLKKGQVNIIPDEEPLLKNNGIFLEKQHQINNNPGIIY